MNRLASNPSALLVDRATWERFSLNTGDTVELRVTFGGETSSTSSRLPACFNSRPTTQQMGRSSWPTWTIYSSRWGGPRPYDVWLRPRRASTRMPS